MSCWCSPGRPFCIEAAPVGEIDVEPSIVVVIKKSDSTSFRFDDEALVFGTAPYIRNLEAGALCDINKLHRRRWCGCDRGFKLGSTGGPPQWSGEPVEQSVAKNQACGSEKASTWNDHLIRRL